MEIGEYVISVDDHFFQQPLFDVVDYFFQQKKKPDFFQTNFIRVGAGSGLGLGRVRLRSGVFFAENNRRPH